MSQLDIEPLRSMQAVDDPRVRHATATAAATRSRIEAIDFARGLAVTLMILSHGVKGLLPFEQFPDWGLVPIHAVTKFSSSLFILVFGIAMAVAYVPHADAPDWPQRRRKLLLTGVVIFFWYKVLTVVEMVHLHDPPDILDALLYRNFPSYVEILGFYALAFLWVPLILPAWKRAPLAVRVASPIALAGLSYLLARNFDFWNIAPLQALLVEHEDYYTWGQLARGPLVLIGLLIGELVRRYYGHPTGRLAVAALLVGAAGALFALFLQAAGDALHQELLAIAHNRGKHPPGLLFMLYSVAGALLILALALLGGEPLAQALRPITIIGQDALKAFVFHIVVIFALFRYLLGYFHSVSYLHALMLTIGLIFATALWIKTTNWIQRHA